MARMPQCRRCAAALDDTNTFPSQIRNKVYLCRTCHYGDVAKWKAKDREKELARKVVSEWRRQLRLQYGLTEEDYWAMFERQGGVCCLCGREPSPKRKLSVEHCHASGRVRGLVCITCNTALGVVERIGLDAVVAHLTPPESS